MALIDKHSSYSLLFCTSFSLSPPTRSLFLSSACILGLAQSVDEHKQKTSSSRPLQTKSLMVTLKTLLLLFGEAENENGLSGLEAEPVTETVREEWRGD